MDNSLVSALAVFLTALVGLGSFLLTAHNAGRADLQEQYRRVIQERNEAQARAKLCEEELKDELQKAGGQIVEMIREAISDAAHEAAREAAREAVEATLQEARRDRKGSRSE